MVPTVKREAEARVAREVMKDCSRIQRSHIEVCGRQNTSNVLEAEAFEDAKRTWDKTS